MDGFLWEIKLIFRSYRQYNTIIQHMVWMNIHPSVKNETQKVQGSSRESPKTVIFEKNREFRVEI